MKSKKIRGLKRRQKEIDEWFSFNKELDFQLLMQNKYCYAKAKVAPWANLFNNQPYPKEYKHQIFSRLFDLYDSWENEIRQHYDNFYLKIWVSKPNFIDSQVVVAIEDKIEYYNGLFERTENDIPFPINEFNREKDRLKLFNWTSNYDYDCYWESEFLNAKPNDFWGIKDYNSEQKFYKNLIKNNTLSRQLTNEYGDEDKLFYKQSGYIWTGQKK